MRRRRSEYIVEVAVGAMMLAACGSTTHNVADRSPAAGTPTVMAAGASPSPSQATSVSPAPADLRLVIADYQLTEVRLARFDATDTARGKGVFDGIGAGEG